MQHFSVQPVLSFVLTCSLQLCFHSHSLLWFPQHLVLQVADVLYHLPYIKRDSSSFSLKLCLRIFLLFPPLSLDFKFMEKCWHPQKGISTVFLCPDANLVHGKQFHFCCLLACFPLQVFCNVLGLLHSWIFEVLIVKVLFIILSVLKVTFLLQITFWWWLTAFSPLL